MAVSSQSYVAGNPWVRGPPARMSLDSNSHTGLPGLAWLVRFRLSPELRPTLHSSDSGFSAPFHHKATRCRGHAGRRPAHPGGPHSAAHNFSNWGRERRPFREDLVAFGLLRREKSEKRGVRWKRLTLKIRLPCDEDPLNKPVAESHLESFSGK